MTSLYRDPCLHLLLQKSLPTAGLKIGCIIHWDIINLVTSLKKSSQVDEYLTHNCNHLGYFMSPIVDNVHVLVV